MYVCLCVFVISFQTKNKNSKAPKAKNGPEEQKQIYRKMIVATHRTMPETNITNMPEACACEFELNATTTHGLCTILNSQYLSFYAS